MNEKASIFQGLSGPCDYSPLHCDAIVFPVPVVVLGSSQEVQPEATSSPLL